MKTRVIKMMAVVLAAGTLLFACGKENVETNGDNNGGSAARHTLTVLPNNALWGAATGSDSYADGTSATIEGAPKAGYYFIRWSDGAVSNPRTVTVSSDMTLYALFSATQNDPNPYNPEDGPNPVVPAGYVDLGLPSGLLWATCNLGATSPEEYGNHYAWGETATKSTYNWTTYRYCNGSDSTMTKYCSNSNYGNNDYTDALTTLEAIDDAATQVLGGGARIPTRAEWLELINNTTVEWTTMNGVNGRLFTAANGNTLFLPAVGYRHGSALNGAGSYCDYWSASLYEYRPDRAWFFFSNSDLECMEVSNRYNGYSVRAVHEK